MLSLLLLLLISSHLFSSLLFSSLLLLFFLHGTIVICIIGGGAATSGALQLRSSSSGSASGDGTTTATTTMRLSGSLERRHHRGKSTVSGSTPPSGAPALSRRSLTRHHQHGKGEGSVGLASPSDGDSLTLLNPFRQAARHERAKIDDVGRWGHLFAAGARPQRLHRPNWKSMCEPAFLPLTATRRFSPSELQSTVFATYHHTTECVPSSRAHTRVSAATTASPSAFAAVKGGGVVAARGGAHGAAPRTALGGSGGRAGR